MATKSTGVTSFISTKFLLIAPHAPATPELRAVRQWGSEAPKRTASMILSIHYPIMCMNYPIDSR